MNTVMPPRKIIHIDMDAFFASVEQRDHPELRGKPVAVGGQGERGVVAAASYEARVFGVRSAMASAKARRLCPDLIFVPHRFEVYRHVSRQIREIFESYTPLVQPLSLDEAYLVVTENLMGVASATQIATEIRAGHHLSGRVGQRKLWPEDACLGGGRIRDTPALRSDQADIGERRQPRRAPEKLLNHRQSHIVLPTCFAAAF